MSKNTKRNNKLDMEWFLVASGNQNLASAGSLFGTGTAMNIADGQLGIISAETSNYNTIKGTATPSEDMIRIIQGTPASSNILTADNAFQAGHKTHVQSEVINKSQVRSITVTDPTPGKRSIQYVQPLASASLTSNDVYGAHVRIKSTREHRDHGFNDNVVFRSFATPDFTSLGATDNRHYMLTKWLTRFNSTSNAMTGTGNYVFLAVSTAGGATGGVDLGTIAPGQNINFITLNGQSYGITADLALVNSLADVIANTSLTATSEIVTIDDTTALTGSDIDCFLVIGLDSAFAQAYDDISQVRNNVEIILTDAFVTNATTVTQASRSQERVGYGRELYFDYKERSRMNIHTQQILPGNEFFIEPQNYIDQSSWYKQVRIDYYETYKNFTIDNLYNKQVTILLPATVSSTNVAGGIVVADAAALTTADLNTALAGWFTDVEYVGSATSANPFGA